MLIAPFTAVLGNLASFLRRVVLNGEPGTFHAMYDGLVRTRSARDEQSNGSSTASSPQPGSPRAALPASTRPLASGSACPAPRRTLWRSENVTVAEVRALKDKVRDGDDQVSSRSTAIISSASGGARRQRRLLRLRGSGRLRSLTLAGVEI
jgi:hypothetical protein